MVLARHRATSLWRTKSSIPNMQNSFWSLFQGRRLKMCNNLLTIPQWTLWKTSQVQQSWFHHLFTNLIYEKFSNQAFLHVHVFDCHVNYLILFKVVVVFVWQSAFTHYCCSRAQKCCLCASHTLQWNQDISWQSISTSATRPWNSILCYRTIRLKGSIHRFNPCEPGSLSG